ncbi:MAG: extracellular solute-binding protein, partial [Planctomycetota bacterium]
MRPAATVVYLLLLTAVVSGCAPASPTPQAGPREVLFWHFWGGKEQAVVEEVVRRFNAQQHDHVVRAVAMPGNNLDLKLFLAITGGAPPDLVNQDDPILADWAARGAILPLSEFVPAAELQTLEAWLFPAAWSLTAYRDTPYGLCNGLDVR